MGALFTNIEPEPDAVARRGPDRVTVDVTSSSAPDPVVSASITISVDGTALTVSTVSIFGGYRATAPYRFNDDTEYEIEITAETVATVGTPASTTFDFRTALLTEGLLIASGSLVDAYGLAAFTGSVPAIANGFLALSGNILTVPDQYLALDGSVVPQLDLLRLGEALILDGWVTVYVTEHLLFAVIQAGEPVGHQFHAALDVYEDAAKQHGLAAALDVYSVGQHPGLLAAINDTQPVAHEFRAAIQAGEPTSHDVRAAIDVDGYAASGMIVIDSPSDAWRDEDEAEDA